ncbi:MAG: LppM family (lipo)protein [Egibacteraceae bacterium]
MRRRGARIVLVAMLAVLCASCRLELDVLADIEHDGAGSLSVRLSADRELLSAAAAAGADPLGDLVTTGRRLSDEGWRTTEETAQDGRRTVTLSSRFADAAAFEALSRDLAAALSADEVDLLEPLRLELDDDEIRLRGSAGLEPTRAVRDYGLSRRQATRLLRRSEAFGYTVSVRLPGEVLSTSASVSDPALTWPVEPGERVAIRAVGERPWPPLLRVLTGGLAGGLAAIGFLAARRLRRR